MSSPKITIYSTPDCIFCHSLMAWLEDLDLEFDEIDVSNPINRAKAEEELGEELGGVPVTLINGVRIDGFNRPAIKRALKKAK